MIRRSQRRWLAITAMSVLSLIAAVGMARATGVGWFNDKPITYPATHFAAVPLQLGVFREQATDIDQTGAANPAVRASVDGVTADDSNVPEEFLPGKAQAGALRIAMAGLGASKRTIYLVRTAKGRICAGLTGFSSGCLAGLPLDTPLTAHSADPDQNGSGEPALVWGVVRDLVQRIDVIVNGQPQPAELARNAYFFQLASNTLAPTAIEAVVAYLRTGEVTRIDVEHGPSSGAHGPTTYGPPPAANG
jgi:hypothetical protein